MVHLIDKDTLVAEIKRRIDWDNDMAATFPDNSEYDYLYRIQEEIYKSLLSFINTIEVKEVDLELNSFDATVCKLGSTYLKEIDKDAIAKALEPYKTGDKVKVIITTYKEE